MCSLTWSGFIFLGEYNWLEIPLLISLAVYESNHLPNPHHHVAKRKTDFFKWKTLQKLTLWTLYFPTMKMFYHFKWIFFFDSSSPILFIYLFIYLEAALEILGLLSTSPLTHPELSIFACFVPTHFKLLDYKQSWMNSAKDVALCKITGENRKEKMKKCSFWMYRSS